MINIHEPFCNQFVCNFSKTFVFVQNEMPLTVHHLQVSQSERIPWLCEELQIPYKLILHQRDPLFAPQSFKDLHVLGQAPIIQDGDLTLAESAACVEYIIHIHGNGKLALPPTHQNYSDYLYWFHFANGNLQPNVLMLLSNSGSNSPATASRLERFRKMLKLIDERLADNTWLAGEEFTAADIMTVFTLTTMRCFYSLDLSDYPSILRYLKMVTDREGYRRARAKADPELELMIDGKAPQSMREKLKAEGKL